MGNHEYCEDCGVNDFHHGRPCDPSKVAARQKARELAEEKRNLDELEKVLNGESEEQKQEKARFWTNDYDILYQSWMFVRHYLQIAHAQEDITDELYRQLDDASMHLKPYWGD